LPVVKILQITKKAPFPLNDGESWAVRNLARGLKIHGCEIDLLSLASELDEIERWRYEISDIYESVEIIRHDTKPHKLGDIRGKQDTPVVLRAHNREHVIWKEYAQNLNGLYKWYFTSQSERIQRFELDTIKKASGVLFVSKKDQQMIKGLGAVVSQVVPIALEVPEQNQTLELPDPIVIGFLGSLDWRPNTQGLQKFLDEIWPSIRNAGRDVRLLIAGKNPDSSKLKISDSDVSFIGQVDDSRGFISQLHALIVPLWSGSGTRVKILEAMSLGIPVITTPKGCEGLDVNHREHLFISDSSEDWLASIEDIDNQALVNDMRSNGRDYIRASHSMQDTGKQAYNFLQSLL